MRKTLQSSFLSYGIAILSIIAAVMLTWALWPLMQRCVFLFFMVAVMLSAWRGHGPGLLATVLSVVLSEYFFFTPLHTIGVFDYEAGLTLFFFVPAALLVSIFTAESHRVRQGLAETVEKLEAIISASPLAIFRVDAQSKTKKRDPAADRIFGWSSDEVIGRPNPVVPDKFEEYRCTEYRCTNEQQLRATFEQAAVGFAQATREGKLLMVNQRLCEFLGYTQAELLEMNVMDITSPEDRDMSHEYLNELWAGKGQASTIEKRYLRKDGSSVTANLSVSVVRDGSGNPLSFIGAVEDTTERKRAESALRESEERFRVIFDYAAVGIAQVALDGSWLMANQQLCSILGYTQDELLGRTFQEATIAEDLEASLAGMRSLLAGERETFAQEKRYVRKDRSLVWVRVSVSVLRDSSGDPKSFLSVVEDISGRKKAEQELVRLATAVEQAAESIVITDTEGTIQYVNPAFEGTTGYTRDEAIGQNSSLLKSGKQDSDFYRDLWEAIKRGEVWTGHFTNRRKDGSIYEEEATISPVRDASGNLVNFVAVKRDVTKEVGLENQLMQAQKMEAIGQLAGGVAHDFNNLLTAVIGYSQLALRNLDDNDPKRADIAEIEKAGLRAAELTGQLLAFSRKQIFHPKNLALNALVTDLQKMLRRLIGEDIDLVAVLDLELGTVRADPGQLQQVIMNLIVNARDALPLGGKVTIETANVNLDSNYATQHIDVSPGAYCVLAISDNGSGMDEETRSHIFEPFFTTKELGRGTGLGLSTVYGIVKQSGGYISVYSEPGRGSTFKIYLPRIAELIEDEHPLAPRALPRGDETLLLVEDEPAVRELAARVLREHGYTVLEASDPYRALGAVANRPPSEVHLLVTDVIMPQMSGCDLAKHLAPRRPDMRVLYVSGYADRAIVRNGVLDEETPFLQKPFTAAALVSKVREVLDAPHTRG